MDLGKLYRWLQSMIKSQNRPSSAPIDEMMEQWYKTHRPYKDKPAFDHRSVPDGTPSRQMREIERREALREGAGAMYGNLPLTGKTEPHPGGPGVHGIMDDRLDSSVFDGMNPQEIYGDFDPAKDKKSLGGLNELLKAMLKLSGRN